MFARIKNDWFRSSTVWLPRALLALAITMALPLSAQIQQTWTRSFAGTFSGYIGGFSVAALDGQSNLCLTGTADGDFLTVKYSPAGSLIWSNGFDGGEVETAGAVAADALGQVWVSGISRFTDGTEQSAAMVIKYDAGGSLVWTQRVHTNVTSAALVVDGSGNSYVAGALLGGWLYVVKYSSGGNELWARTYLSTPGWFMSFGAVAIDGAGNVVLAGLATDLNTFSRRNVLVKFDPTGSLSWSNETLPYMGGGTPSAMTLDPLGNVYVSGNGILATKVSPEGALDWTRSRSGSLPTFSNVQVDPAGNLVVAGTDTFYHRLCSDCGDSATDYHLFRTRLSPNGTILWPERSYKDFGFGYMQFDADGSCYLGGSFSSSSDDGLPPHPDSILVKYAPNGSELWRTNFSTGFLAGIRVDGAGNIYLINGISGPVGIRKYVQPQTAPAIRSQPLSRTILDGDDVNFGVSGSGFPSPTFQWRFNGAVLPATNDTLFVAAATANEAGSYTVVLSNTLGSVTSSIATLTVNLQAPTVAPYFTQGTNSVLAGSPVTICAGATGGPKPSLQWRFNGTNLSEQTNACLSLGSVHLTNAGSYEIIASNSLGVVTGAVTLTVKPLAIAFSSGQSTETVAVGSCFAIYSSILLSPETYSLQWQHNGLELNGETNRTLYRCVSDTNQSGQYALVLAEGSGSHTSAPVTLTAFYQPPQFSFFSFGGIPTNALLSNDFTVCAYFTGSPAQYQWRFNGADIAGQTNDCLTLFQISSNLAGSYSIVASNTAGVSTSTVQPITVSSQSPQFVAHPGDSLVVEGGNVAFQAAALAGPPAVHVLQFNGTNTGVPYVGARFGLFDVTPADAGSYRVIASNMFGMATSAVATLTVTPAGPLDRWTARNPLPQSQQINAVCHSTNQFVAVGQRGTIMNSPDGTNWTVQSRRADLSLNGVAYGGGVFVAVGNRGMLLSSQDGTNWAYRYSGGFTTWESVTYGDGRFVAVGSDFAQSTVVGTSTDGIDWTSSGVPGVLAQNSVTFGQSVFVAAGDSAIIHSPNGTSWTLTTNPPVEIETLFFANGAFVAAGDDGTFLVSSNGIAWSARIPPPTSRRLQSVIYGGGRWVAAGARGTILTSTDTVAWNTAISGTPDRIETLDFDKGLFVALGENGTTLTSTDGMSWTKRNFGTTRDLDGMGVAQGTAVIVGKAGTILTSTDGNQYVPRNAGITNDLHGIEWGNGLWVAVGEPGVILTSSNAVNWESRVTGSSSSLKAATWGHAGWVVVGTQGTILTSANGKDWQAMTSSPAYDLNDVASGNGAYVIAGDGPNNRNGSAFISSNAAAWSVVANPIGKNLRSVTFADGRFTFAANDGLIYALTNTAVAQVGFFGGGNLRDLIRLDGMWAIVGNNGVIGTTIHGLTNGAFWTLRPSRTFENLHQIAYLDGRLIAIGNRGTILQSGRFVAKMEQPVISGDMARIPFHGVLNQDYRFEASTNLAVWQTLMTFTNVVERVILQDPGAVGHGTRFYRVTPP